MPLIIGFRTECSSEISETMPGDLSSYGYTLEVYNTYNYTGLYTCSVQRVGG